MATLTNGSLVIQGQQYGTTIPGGSAFLGPWTIACSGCSDTQSVGVGSAQSITVPTATTSGAVPTGCIINGNGVSGMSLKAGYTSATLNFIAPNQVSVMTFDPANLPTSIVLTVVGTGAVASVQFF